MMMTIDHPQSAQNFFAKVFEFVTFDIIPWTEDIYAYVFGWTNIPYSDAVEAVGYPSRFIIENSGSIPIFILAEIVLLLVYSVVKRLLRTGRIHNYAEVRWNGFFWAGFNDFFNEIYITMSFAVCINSSRLEFSSTAIGINNVYGICFALFIVFGPILLSKKVYSAWNKPIVIDEPLS